MDDTTSPSYWLNWRFFICALLVFLAMILSAVLIWKYEGHKQSRDRSNEEEEEEAAGLLYSDETWGTCLQAIHPIWLLCYRIIAFGILLSLLIADIIARSATIFYFYTQWTFTLVTIYFGLGSLLSIHGCLIYCKPEKGHRVITDAEHGSYIPPTLEENSAVLPDSDGSFSCHDGLNGRSTASVWDYSLQIIFQICSGTVVLTDFVFWSVIYPFLTSKNYRLNYLVVCMHSVNALLLLGDAILNKLRFPFFRLVYFALWTCTYVIFQWIIHIIVSLRWPYPFMDLSSPYAPLWYLAVGILHLPCFGLFYLVYCIKRRCFMR